MATIGQDVDAAFFDLMYHFLATSQEDEGGPGRNEPGTERRRESRRAFQLTQRIAPGYCSETPPESAWINVQCYDLVQCGFSFFLDEQPTFDRLVARFTFVEPIDLAARRNPLAAGVGRRPGRHYRARHTIGRRDFDHPRQRTEVPRRLPVHPAIDVEDV